jgi:hypothetical protein
MPKNEPKKECIFLHGAGESIVGPIQNASHNYWGNVHDYVPQCDVTVFSFEDTKNNGWDNQELQKRYCSIALSNQPQGEKIIKNKVIFTHSMANLLLSAGIHNGFCDMDNSTSWYAVDPPFHGSKAANMVTEVCKIKDPSSTDALYQWVSHTLGYCVPGEYRAYPGTSTNRIEYCSPEDGVCMKDLRAIAEPRLKGIQCGYSEFGLYTLKYSVPLESLAAIIGYGEDSDGLVPYSSCAFEGKDRFVGDYSAPWYRSATNHADGNCRNGDGWWGADRKPCSWYSHKE